MKICCIEQELFNLNSFVKYLNFWVPFFATMKALKLTYEGLENIDWNSLMVDLVILQIIRIWIGKFKFGSKKL